MGLHADAKQGNKPLIIPWRWSTLETGDYSLDGHENEVAVERKSLTDLYGTLGGGRQRFEAEVERLAVMSHAAIVIEATWDRIMREPPPGSRLNPKTIYRTCIAWTQRFPRVHWFPVVDRRMAEITTFRILERWWNENVRKKEAACQA